MELSAYLHRIGYAGAPRPDLETLTALHRAHLLAIPYENLDVQLGRRITTDPAEAYDKIVRRGRGGWCYEMNGLFGWALAQIGFKVTRLAGHAAERHSHLVLKVELDATYIADVGFSDGPFEPFADRPGRFAQRGFEFEVEPVAGGFRLNNHRFGASKGYDCGGPDEPAMAQRCLWLQTAPESPFTQNAVVARHTPDGVVTLIGRMLREVAPDGVSRELVEDADAYVAVLKSRFGLDLPEAAGLWPAICARHEAVLREKALAKAAAAAG